MTLSTELNFQIGCAFGNVSFYVFDQGAVKYLSPRSQICSMAELAGQGNKLKLKFNMQLYFHGKS